MTQSDATPTSRPRLPGGTEATSDAVCKTSPARQAGPTDDVSIIVCTHNRAALLERAVESLLALESDGSFAFEIVIVDNASTDATAGTVRRIAARAGVDAGVQSDPDAASVRVTGPSPLNPHLLAVRYAFEPRKGIATARNRGLAEARGGWIAFFDDDQLADPRWLIELLATARQQRARCVGGKVELALPDGCLRRLAPVCRMLLGGTVLPDRLRRYTHRVTPGTGNLLVHRTAFDHVGWFNERFNHRGEDTDLFLRMLAAGIDGWYTPRAVVHHVIPPERLDEAWFLETARRTAEGMADDERRAWGPVLFPLVWLARVVQSTLVLSPRWLLARASRDPERILGTRCRLAIAKRHVGDGLRLLFPRRPGRDSHRKPGVAPAHPREA